MELLRYQLFLIIGVGFVAIWLGVQRTAAFHGLPPSSIKAVIILYAPIWGILLLGLYAVGCVGYGLLNFKDTPEAAAEIDQQILEARMEMKKRGVIKD